MNKFDLSKKINSVIFEFFNEVNDQEKDLIKNKKDTFKDGFIAFLEAEISEYKLSIPDELSVTKIRNEAKAEAIAEVLKNFIKFSELNKNNF